MKRRSPLTPLEFFIRAMKLRPGSVHATAERMAQRLGMRNLSRQQFTRIRYGRAQATQRVMKLLVATMREATGLAVAATDLFELEPPSSGSHFMATSDDPFHGGRRDLPIFLAERTRRPWSLAVSKDQPADQTHARRFEVLYREHSGLLRSTAKFRYKVPQADVDGLVHDVFASYFERQPRVDDIRAYLLMAINHACQHYWRKRKHEAPLTAEHEDTADASVQRRLDQWTLHLSLGATLARLGPKCRETLRRYYLRGERPESIARELDTTARYVFQLLHTCRKRAREIYRKLTEPK